MKFILGSMVFFLLLGAVYVTQAGSDPNPRITLEYDLSIDGPALFYRNDGSTRKALWRVDCSLPLRGCVARAEGLILRVDQNRDAWLIAVKSKDARLSVQQRNYTMPLPQVFNAPLTPEIIASLSGPDSFLVIENNGQVLMRAQTQSLDQVISYLLWINSAKARTLRDARLWPDSQAGALNQASLAPDVLERLEILNRREATQQIGHKRQLVPVAKPQVQFAINAQNGHSFYGADGRAGY